jgi:hypothetical protein
MLRPVSIPFRRLDTQNPEAKPIIRVISRASDLYLVTFVDGDITLPGRQVVNSLDFQALLKTLLGRPLGGNSDG